MKTPTIKRLKSFRVSKRMWFRGHGIGKDEPHNSELIRSADNKKCCLGFFCLQAGVPRHLLIDTATPSCIAIPVPQLVTHDDDLAYDDKPTVRAIMSVNDDVEITDPQRITRLRKLFRRLGVRAIFTK